MRKQRFREGKESLFKDTQSAAGPTFTCKPVISDVFSKHHTVQLFPKAVIILLLISNISVGHTSMCLAQTNSHQLMSRESSYYAQMTSEESEAQMLKKLVVFGPTSQHQTVGGFIARMYQGSAFQRARCWGRGLRGIGRAGAEDSKRSGSRRRLQGAASVSSCTYSGVI